MFCVIQEIQRKKPNQYGEYRDLEAYSPYDMDGRPKYAYRYTGGRFERPIKTAYKISIHESKRKSGVVTKKQYAVTTVDYYTLIDFWVGDCIMPKKMESIAESLNVSVDTLWDLINAKVDPIQDRINAEYKKTEEYKTHAKHERILKKYHSKKEAFAKGYSVDADKYDYCYNIYGEVMNKGYLDEIIAADQQRQQAYSSYYKKSSSNYNTGDWGSYLKSFSSNYSTEEKSYLKQFYKSLSIKFHPDTNRDRDTTKEMQLLNKLKADWGL